MPEGFVTDTYGDAYLDLPKINIDLFYEIVDWLNSPVKDIAWQQGDWFRQGMDGEHILSISENGTATNLVEPNWCGTACCVAGYAALSQLDNKQAYALNAGGVPTVVTKANGEKQKTLNIGHAGQVILGLTDSEANRLFDGSNTKAAVIETLAEIAANRGYHLEA